MGSHPAPVDVAILAMPETTASVIYGMYDLFRSAGRDWQWLTTGVPGASPVAAAAAAVTVPMMAGEGCGAGNCSADSPSASRKGWCQVRVTRSKSSVPDASE